MKSGVMTVHSHSNQKKIRRENDTPSASATASLPAPLLLLPRQKRPYLVEIIPPSSSWRGGERIAILGDHFVDEEREMRVRFGEIVCVPEFFSTKTLICIAPRHTVGWRFRHFSRYILINFLLLFLVFFPLSFQILIFVLSSRRYCGSRHLK